MGSSASSLIIMKNDFSEPVFRADSESEKIFPIGLPIVAQWSILASCNTPCHLFCNLQRVISGLAKPAHYCKQVCRWWRSGLAPAAPTLNGEWRHAHSARLRAYAASRSRPVMPVTTVGLAGTTMNLFHPIYHEPMTRSDRSRYRSKALDEMRRMRAVLAATQCNVREWNVTQGCSH